MADQTLGAPAFVRPGQRGKRHAVILGQESHMRAGRCRRKGEDPGHEGNFRRHRIREQDVFGTQPAVSVSRRNLGARHKNQPAHRPASRVNRRGLASPTFQRGQRNPPGGKPIFISPGAVRLLKGRQIKCSDLRAGGHRRFHHFKPPRDLLGRVGILADKLDAVFPAHEWPERLRSAERELRSEDNAQDNALSVGPQRNRIKLLRRQAETQRKPLNSEFVMQGIRPAVLENHAVGIIQKEGELGPHER
ncbi:MAG: hypothetical protein BWX84_03251 [Verrucomicrobia bacterium ADurb.Bin118]|nr:MAG: hypothetical protein BWX84_03251 [Verrucomicrobia bacterium ADurb.Bin118]